VGEFDKLVIVGVGESLTNWLLWEEFDKLVTVGVRESLTNWLLWAWGSLINCLLWTWRRVCQTGYCGRGGEFDKLVIVGVGRV
jgi:hypothetical protein